MTKSSLVSIFGKAKTTLTVWRSKAAPSFSCSAFLLPDLGLESTREEEVLGRPTRPRVYMFPSLQLLTRASPRPPPWPPPRPPPWPPPHPPVTAFSSLDAVTDGDKEVSITLILCWLYFTCQRKHLSYLPNEYWHQHLEFLLWRTRAALHDSFWLNLKVCSLKQVILVLCPLSRFRPALLGSSAGHTQVWTAAELCESEPCA